jgi:hypothetical protein
VQQHFRRLWETATHKTITGGVTDAIEVGRTPSTAQVVTVNQATPDAQYSDETTVAITGGVTGGIHVGVVAAAEATSVFANAMTRIFTGEAPDASLSDTTTISSWEMFASDENTTSSSDEN